MSGSIFLRKRWLAAGLLVATGAAAWRLRHEAWFRPEYWLRLVQVHPVGAPLLFVPAYALAVTFLIPTLPLNLIAGALWGPVLGTVVSLAGAFSGAVLGFVLARGAFGQPLAQRVDTKFLKWMQEEFERHGWKVVAFVRLNPIFPGPVSFLFGFTPISFTTYCWSSALFLLPPTIAFAVIGSSVGEVVLRGYIGNLRNTLLLVGTSLAFLVGSALLLRQRYQTSLDAPEADAVD
jgi:uncharacterized membrane protein YdjX (TVP38/TMEM64 family)